MLKSVGYLISILSVFMLGAVSWRATETDPELRFWLMAGIAASIIGMLCRWLSYQLQEKPSGADRARASSPARRTS